MWSERECIYHLKGYKAQVFVKIRDFWHSEIQNALI